MCPVSPYVRTLAQRRNDEAMCAIIVIYSAYSAMHVNGEHRARMSSVLRHETEWLLIQLHLSSRILLLLPISVRFYAEIASFTASTIEAKKKSSTKIIDNNLLARMYGVCWGYPGMRRIYCICERGSVQQRIKSILFYSTNDDDDKAAEWVEEQRDGQRGVGGRGKQQKYSSFLLCELVYLWHQMNFVETISLSGEHLATETVRRQRKSYRALDAHMFIICFHTQKEQQQQQHRAADLLRI